MTQSNWHVVHTKLHCEQKVANLLTRKHIKTYCPLHEKESQGSEGKRIILEPLFTSYVFVWIQEQERAYAKNTSGVLNFVYWLSEPVIVTPEEIDSIKVILRDYTHVKLEPFSLKKNPPGEIIESSLLLQPNNKTDHALKVMLPSLGYYLVACGRKEDKSKPDQNNHFI